MDNLSFVCFSYNNWEKRKARKQQFMLFLSQRQDVEKVLYIEPALNFFRLLLFPFSELKDGENRRRWKRALRSNPEPLSDKLFIFTPVFFIPFSFRCQWIYNLNLFFLAGAINAKSRRLGLKNIVLWLYHPLDYAVLKCFKNRILAVFDWAEEWADYFIELSAKKRRQVACAEEVIVRNCDLVFTVSERLRQKAGQLNPASYRLLDGTVAEVFSGRDVDSASEIAKIKKPILGYLGTISERLDIDLLRFIAASLPEVSIVLIGAVRTDRVDVRGLKAIPNLYFLGQVQYEELGKYTPRFDVSILPYRPQMSLNISPTKIFDYLAIGKPIISTALEGLDDFRDDIKISHSKEEFLAQVKEALGGEDAGLCASRRQKARENSWAKRSEEIVALIQKSLCTKY